MGNLDGKIMKDYFALKIQNETLFFDSAEKLYNELLSRSIPASKCSFTKILNVDNLSNSQNYMETHQTVLLSYDEIKEILHSGKRKILH